MSDCCVCFKPKSPLVCAACEQSVCKNCAQFLDESTFGFWDQRPVLLQQSVFCGPCYTLNVEPALELYNQQLIKAKNLSVFFDNQGKETRTIPRKEMAIKVEGMTDREETLLKLAFQAVLAGFNGLIDVNITSQKIRNGSYQTSVFSGSGIPTNLTDRKLAKD